MLLKYFFDPKLAHASYLVACQATGEAIIIDPGRNIEIYLEAAAKEGVRVIAATETHIHADFVSGCRELAHRTGATLYLSGAGGPDWQYQYLADLPHYLLKDGDSWRIGNIKFEAMHTPGHTPEHMAFMVTDTATTTLPLGIFSGDFVFVGDVGRPDLLETAAGIKGAKEQGARALFKSLQSFKHLPDYLQIWPAHGAGSACGKALGAVPSTTLGYERRTNWAFQIDNESEFVTSVLTGQPEPPRYFATMKRVNKEGPVVSQNKSQYPCLSAEDLDLVRLAGCPIMDTRSPAKFVDGFVPGSFNNPYAANSFLTYAGCFLVPDEPLYLIIDPAEAMKAVSDLRRIGIDKVAGYFSPETVAVWAEQTGHTLQTIPQASVCEQAEEIKTGRIMVVDVRSAAEFAAGHLPHAHNLVLGDLFQHLADIPTDQPVLLQCRSGFRSNIAAGVMASQGRSNMLNLRGGYQAWCLAGQPVVNGYSGNGKKGGAPLQ
jgi:hydroxyacylglutathione hydrolase